MKRRELFFIALLAFAIVLFGYANQASAQPTYFTSQGCSGCHGATATCNGCHQHGTHASLNGAINVKGTTDKASYAPGATVSVTITGGFQSGWIRAILYDQSMKELARSTGPTGTGGGAGYPITLTAPAPATPGTYTWNVSWYGNYMYNPGPFQTACSGTIITNCWKPSSNANHGEEIVATNSFTVASSAAPAITVTDSVPPANDLSVPFGSVTTGTSSTQTVTVQNTGTANLAVGAVGSTNALVAPFSIKTDTCSNQTIVPSASCTLTVAFAPTSTGAFSGSFNIPSNDPAKSSVVVSVSGTGTGVPTPAITVTDSVAPTNDHMVPFGTIQTGSSVTQTVTVTNSGNAALAVGAVGSTSALTAPFSIKTDTCSNQSVLPSASCTLTVAFAPTAAGSFTGSFNIPSNDPSQASVTVSVSGTGSSTAVGKIQVTDSVPPINDLMVPFGDVSEGRSVDNTVTVTNIASGQLVIGNIASANPLAAPFSIAADNCTGKTLASGANCTITVQFSPPKGGCTTPVTGGGGILDRCPSSESFDIPSNDPSTPDVIVQVSGAAVVPKGNTAPSKPEPKYPANQQRDLDTTIMMQWLPSTDPDGDPITYELQISKDQAFSPANTIIAGATHGKAMGMLYAGTGLGFVFFGFAFIGSARGRKGVLLIAALVIIVGSTLVSCSSNSGNGTQPSSGVVVSRQVSGLQTSTIYYWKVIASDGNGGVTESDVFTFTTK